MKQNNIFFRYFSPVAAQQKLYAAALVALLSSSAYEAEAQVGEPFIHDPSTIALCDGKYYTFGTGEGGIWSEDGWTWQGGAVRPGRGAAPDVLKIGDRYLVAYSATGGGLGGSHRGDVLTMWNKTLDPKSPDFKYTEPVVVASSLDDEDCDAIDAGLLLDPTTGRLWLSYGTYFGFIRLVELDPKTGKRMEGNEPVNIAIDCEATDLIYRNGWYYLLGTHGTCCDGPNSTYNIVVGRSRKITGPYVDNVCSVTVLPSAEECCWISDRRRTERWMNARRKFFWIWADGFMTIRKRYLEQKKDWITIISSAEARFRRIRRRCIFSSMISRRRHCV